MTGKLIAMFTGFCMILTILAAAPARADENTSAAGILTGAIALFVLSSILANELDGQEPEVQKNFGLPPLPLAPNRVDSAQVRGSFGRFGSTSEPAGNGRFGEHKHKVLPQDCAFTIEQDHRERLVYGAACLKDKVRKAKWLPTRCVSQARVRHGGYASVYDAACLRQDGWREEQFVQHRN